MQWEVGKQAEGLGGKQKSMKMTSLLPTQTRQESTKVERRESYTAAAVKLLTSEKEAHKESTEFGQFKYRQQLHQAQQRTHAAPTAD